MHSSTLLPTPSVLGRLLRGRKRFSFILRFNQALKNEVSGLKDCAVARLKQPRTGCLEGEGRKRTSVRVIELGTYGSLELYYLTSLAVEECEA